MKYVIIENDIAITEADAIVLPANPKLREGSGASRAIFEMAGREKLTEACRNAFKRAQGHGFSTGWAIPTEAYNLHTKYVLHTVVPKWNGGTKAKVTDSCQLLSQAYLSALTVADQLNCETLAIPLLGAGNNGFNPKLSFEIAKENIVKFEPQNQLKQVLLVIYGPIDVVMVKQLGEEVAEIREPGSMSRDLEKYKTVIEKTMERSKNVVQQYSEEFLERAFEFLKDPENRKLIIGQASAAVRATVVNYFENNSYKKLENQNLDSDDPDNDDE